MVIAAPALNFQPKQATLPVKSFLQRLLLVTDSNIIDILQTYLEETVVTTTLHQQLVITGSRFSPLQLQRDYQLLNRTNMLQGSTTRINYLSIEAQIVLERLPIELRDQVMFSQQPLDKIFQQHKLETYRQILDCGVEPGGAIAEYFRLKPNAELIYRTYLVVVKGLPAIQVTEKFPSSHFI